jgi:gamma-glutamyltranspeptidase/glutathione hydrolase
VLKQVLKVLRLIFILLVLVILAGALIFALLPRGPQDLMEYQETWRVPRPMVEAATQIVVTGTPWATEAAMDVMNNGGNAFDAAAAALLVINVTYGEAASFPGVAPLVLYDAETDAVRSYIGTGTAPAVATIEFFRERGFETMPEFNILSQLLPASPDVIVALLRDHGTMSFGEIAGYAIQIGRDGFPIFASLKDNLDFSLIERVGFSFMLPYNSQIFLQGRWWDDLHLGDRTYRTDLANTLDAMAQAEQAALNAGSSREEGLQVVRDYFYAGPIADSIVAFHEANGGLFTHEDLAGYTGGWEEPITGNYEEYTLYTNGPWNQGIVVVQALQILQGIDLAAMGHNSPEYIHTVNQAIELAMSDRDTYVADPAFVDVPLEVLTSASYADQRRATMTANQAFPALPPPGTIEGVTTYREQPATRASAGTPVLYADSMMIGQDTSHLAIIDSIGNAITITPSDFPRTPMIPDTGLNLGNRMIQFRLDENHINHLEPGRRPRITPHAVIVYRNGEFWMAYGTPGGDVQPQALIQVFLNMTVFGMNVQEAIDAPRFRTMSYEDSFSPHESYPATLHLESTIYITAAQALTSMGYTVVEYEDWHPQAFGAVGAVLRENGTLYAGADPRENTWALGE